MWSPANAAGAKRNRALTSNRRALGVPTGIRRAGDLVVRVALDVVHHNTGRSFSTARRWRSGGACEIGGQSRRAALRGGQFPIESIPSVRTRNRFTLRIPFGATDTAIVCSPGGER